MDQYNWEMRGHQLVVFREDKPGKELAHFWAHDYLKEEWPDKAQQLAQTFCDALNTPL